MEILEYIEHKMHFILSQTILYCLFNWPFKTHPVTDTIPILVCVRIQKM